jgi:hypothetical protein
MERLCLRRHAPRAGEEPRKAAQADKEARGGAGERAECDHHVERGHLAGEGHVEMGVPHHQHGDASTARAVLMHRLRGYGDEADGAWQGCGVSQRGARTCPAGGVWEACTARPVR